MSRTRGRRQAIGHRFPRAATGAAYDEQTMFRLDTVVQHDAWGSMSALPSFLGAAGDGRPHSELWMGTHPLGPSRVRAPDGGSFGLRDLVGQQGLPYLFKVLAADRPLSLQVHPDRAM